MPDNAAILRHGNRDSFHGEEEGVEAPSDGSQISPVAGNGAGGHALAAIEPLDDGEPSSRSSHEPSSMISRRRTMPPATERAYTHDWADFAAFCGRHGLAPLPGGSADPRALSRGHGDAAQPLSGRPCRRDGRALAASG